MVFKSPPAIVEWFEESVKLFSPITKLLLDSLTWMKDEVIVYVSDPTHIFPVGKFGTSFDLPEP